jgi:aryl-alcohol dehydrogenase-like predicted oxidoreductase
LSAIYASLVGASDGWPRGHSFRPATDTCCAVPIPETKRRQHLDENLGAVKVTLNSDDLADLNPLASIVSGERYPTHTAKLAER